MVYDDYGHHPTAIRETLAAVRQREPGRRVWAVYEPLTFHRTAAMLDASSPTCCRGADAVAIADIWAGRDPDTTIASAADLAAAIAARRPGLPVLAPGSVEATADRLAERGPPGRRRAGHGRWRELSDRRTAAGPIGGDAMIDYAAAGECSRHTGGRGQTFDGDAWVALFTDDAEYHEDPFGTPLVGHNALRAYLLDASASQRDVEFTVERHWVSGTTILAAWHVTFVRRASGRRRPDGRVPDRGGRLGRARRAGSASGRVYAPDATG